MKTRHYLLIIPVVIIIVALLTLPAYYRAHKAYLIEQFNK